MTPDPRGPMRVATAVDPTHTVTLVTLDCGHIASFAQHFHYNVGDEHRCYQCWRKDHEENV